MEQQQEPLRPPRSNTSPKKKATKITHPCRFYKVTRLCFTSRFLHTNVLHGGVKLLWIRVYIPRGSSSCSGGDGAHYDRRVRSWNDCLFSGSTQGLCTSKKLWGRQSGRGGASALPLLCSYWPYLIQLCMGVKEKGPLEGWSAKLILITCFKIEHLKRIQICQHD